MTKALSDYHMSLAALTEESWCVCVLGKLSYLRHLWK